MSNIVSKYEGELMKRILFICHGNICRSVMAEYMFKEKVRQLGVEDQFEADSAATSREELGNEMYPPAKRMLTIKGIPFGHHRARQITREDDHQGGLWQI